MPGCPYCIFHAPRQQKKAEEFCDRFYRELENVRRSRPGDALDCRGFIFPKINLQAAKFPCIADFRGAHFTDAVDFRGAMFLSQADFHTTEFDMNANFFSVLFLAGTRFLGTRFKNRAIFNGSKFRGTTTFHGCKFGDFAGFQSTRFDRHLTFQSNEFIKDADFRAAIFYDGIDLTQTSFRKRADFHGTRFHGEVCLAETHIAFLKKLNCRHADMRGAVLHTAQIWENEMLSYYDFRGAFLLSVNLSGKLLRDCDFTGAVFKSVLTVGWRPDRKTLENTKCIYTDYTTEEQQRPDGRKMRVYAPVPESRVPAEGDFGVGEHANFSLASYLHEPVRLNIALNVPAVLRTAVSNYLQLFGDFVKVTEGIPVELRTRLEGTKLRVEFLARTEDDLVAVKNAFREYQQSAGLDFESLKLRIRFAKDVPQLERDLFLMKLESQTNQLRTELTYTKALLSKSEEHQALLKRIVEASRAPYGLLMPVALPTAPSIDATQEEDESTLRLVFSYSHKDEELRDQLETHLALLKRNGIIRSWHDRKITPGEEWDHNIDRAFAEADLVLLLISSDFICSDYCFEKELTASLERHERREAKVIPIIVRACDWKGAPFGKLQGLPTDMTPVASWPDRDEAWTDVSRGIRAAAQTLIEQRMEASRLKSEP